ERRPPGGRAGAALPLPCRSGRRLLYPRPRRGATDPGPSASRRSACWCSFLSSDEAVQLAGGVAVQDRGSFGVGRAGREGTLDRLLERHGIQAWRKVGSPDERFGTESVGEQVDERLHILVGIRRRARSVLPGDLDRD